MRRCCPLLFVNSGWELPAISASSRPQEPPPSKMAAGGNGGLSFSGVVSNSAPSNRGGTVSTSYNYSGGAAVSSPGNQTASAASSAGASPPAAPPPPLPAAAGLLHREPVYNWQATKTTVRERFTFLFNNEVLSDVHFLVGKGLGSQRIPAHRYRILRLPILHSRLVTPTLTAQGWGDKHTQGVCMLLIVFVDYTTSFHVLMSRQFTTPLKCDLQWISF